MYLAINKTTQHLTHLRQARNLACAGWAVHKGPRLPGAHCLDKVYTSILYNICILYGLMGIIAKHRGARVNECFDNIIN